MVLDTVALELKPRRAKQWRGLRDGALGHWAAAGLMFTIVEDQAAEYPVFDPNDLRDAQLEEMMVQPYLRLMRMSAPYAGSIPAIGTWMPATDPAAFAAFYLGASFWLTLARIRKYRVTHEIGHCLGLNHTTVGSSVMYVSPTGFWSGNTEPDVHDIDSMKAYYGSHGAALPLLLGGRK
jgi:hypothetical protein